MIVNEPGKYKLTQDWTTRSSTSIRQVPAGTILEITQVDKTYHKVIGPALLDWMHWDIPVVRVVKEVYGRGRGQQWRATIRHEECE